MRLSFTKTIMALAFLSVSLYSRAEFFYYDKDYADLLIKNNICADYQMRGESSIPKELMPFVLTSGTIKSDSALQKDKGQKEYLFPSEVIVFSKDGNFKFIYIESASTSNSIKGKWRVENSALILKFENTGYPSPYINGSELRYSIVNAVKTAATPLKLKGMSFPLCHKYYTKLG